VTAAPTPCATIAVRYRRARMTQEPGRSTIPRP
jgi:hypothetical protein